MTLAKQRVPIENFYDFQLVESGRYVVEVETTDQSQATVKLYYM